MAKTQHQPTLPHIHNVRGKKVVLDSDLARLYGILPKRLNEAVNRNLARFPDDFCFFVTRQEFASLKSQIATSSSSPEAGPRSRSAILENRHGGSRKPPRLFTEHGALMAANVLRSQKAIEMSMYLIRAFVQMRETLQTNATILKRLAEIDHRLIEHDSVLREIVQQLQPLLDAPKVPEGPKPKIGFHPGNR